MAVKIRLTRMGSKKKVEIHTVSRFSKNSLSSNIINETIQIKSDALLQRIL